MPAFPAVSDRATDRAATAPSLPRSALDTTAPWSHPGVLRRYLQWRLLALAVLFMAGDAPAASRTADGHAAP